MEGLNISKTGIYSITDAAKILGISSRTLRRYAYAGQVKYSISRINGRKRFKGADLILLYNKM